MVFIALPRESINLNFLLPYHQFLEPQRLKPKRQKWLQKWWLSSKEIRQVLEELVEGFK
jgi:hypothetical protein